MAEAAITLEDLAATCALAQRLAAALSPGGLVLLLGELGAGKTALVRCLVAALGGDETLVSSPTYTLLHAYDLAAGHLAHVDAYRLTDEADLDGIGALEQDADTITCIEWADRIEGLVDRPDAWVVRLEHAGGGKRHASITVPRGKVFQE